MSVKRISLINICLLSVILFWQPLVIAKESTDYVSDDVFTMSLVELLELQVETASAKKERIDDAPANIYVVTARDIEARGYRRLVDIPLGRRTFNLLLTYRW